MTIRELTADDVPGAHRLLSDAFPTLVLSEEAVRWRLEHGSPGADNRALVRVRNGRITGHVRSVLRDGVGTTLLIASDDGPGTDLLAASERSLVERGARSLRVTVAEEGVQRGGRSLLAFLEGGEVVDTHQILGLDLRDLPNLPAAPLGAELRAWREFEPRALYEIDRLTNEDEPGEAAAFPSFDDWYADTWGHPLSDLDLSLVLLIDGRPVAITCYVSDRKARMESAMTGTLREFRGRGLAGYAKTVALHRAREWGFTHAYTGNHTDNAPMLAINRSLGYRLVGSEHVFVREVPVP
ncbi:GNAT family N-acetyltransferase [Nocardiopsis sp. FIRDI 009]|uniref:GNAT family N-acetyltransferase n=1 Tax=Nocardiopsis sp. FIRDI 009 TaxID=714197 RepID=UPI000E22B334|nr:GNAT family N-acetyltransferase [Nocardiopsis sp. FIRDI 009]